MLVKKNGKVRQPSNVTSKQDVKTLVKFKEFNEDLLAKTPDMTRHELIQMYSTALEVIAAKIDDREYEIISLKEQVSVNCLEIVELKSRVDLSDSRITKLEEDKVQEKIKYESDKLKSDSRIELLENQSSVLQEMKNHLHAITANIPILETSSYILVNPKNEFYVFYTVELLAKFVDLDIKTVRKALTNNSILKDTKRNIEYSVFRVSDLNKRDKK